MSDTEKALSGFGRMVFAFVTVPIRAFVYWKYWTWFAVPCGLPSLTIWQTLGLSLLIAAFVKNTGSISDVLASQKADEGDKWALMVTNGLVWPVITLGIGWVFHRLIY